MDEENWQKMRDAFGTAEPPAKPKRKRPGDRDGEVRAGEARSRGGAPIKAMAVKDGWVMARRPGCIPFTMPTEDWLALPKAEGCP